MSTEEQEAKVIDDEVPTATTGSSKVVKGEVATVTIEKYKTCRTCKVKVAPDSNAVLASAVRN